MLFTEYIQSVYILLGSYLLFQSSSNFLRAGQGDGIGSLNRTYLSLQSTRQFYTRYNTHSNIDFSNNPSETACKLVSDAQPILHYQPDDPILMVQEEAEKWGFDGQYPLTKDLMMKGLIGRSARSSDNSDAGAESINEDTSKSSEGHFSGLFPNGFKRLYDKFRCKDATVNVVIFGGSMTMGEECWRGMSVRYENCAWQYRVMEWLRRAYPHVNFVHMNLAVSSSSSAFAFSAFRDLIMERHREGEGGAGAGILPDLCIFDNSMNDQGIRKSKGALNIHTVYENIIRLAISQRIAVLVMSVFLGDNHLDIGDGGIEAVYESVCRPYGIPLLSYRLSVLDNVTYANQLPSYDPLYHINHTKLSILWGHTANYYHPPFQGHRCVADHVVYFLYHAHKHYEAEWKKLELKSPIEMLSSVEPMFGALRYDSELHSIANDDNPLEGGGGLECSPASVRLSSLEAEQSAVTGNFTPVINNGWLYRADKPGKPVGWVYRSDNATTNAALGTKAAGNTGEIAFSGMILHGRVTVTFLESYSDCGDFDIWIGEPNRDRWHNGEIGNFHKTTKTKQVRHPYMVPCCHGFQDTTSARISTYKHNLNFSAVVQQTVHFDISGHYAVYIKSVALEDGEYSRRNGDKIKILGITVC